MKADLDALKQQARDTLDARAPGAEAPDDGVDHEVLRRRFLADDARRDSLEPASPRPPVKQTFLFAPREPLRSCFGCATSAHTSSPK